MVVMVAGSMFSLGFLLANSLALEKAEVEAVGLKEAKAEDEGVKGNLIGGIFGGDAPLANLNAVE